MSDHIVKSYDRDLEDMGRNIAEMGGLAEKMLAEAMEEASDAFLGGLQQQQEEQQQQRGGAHPA